MDPIPEQEERFRKNTLLTFGQDIGDSLNQLQFEFEELENNHALPEEKIESVEPKEKQTSVEKVVKENFENEIPDDKDKSNKKSMYSSMRVKAHVFDSLKNVRKRLHIKKGKHHKESKQKQEDAASTTSSEHSNHEDSLPNSRLNSASSSDTDQPKPEQNNNVPTKIEVENILISSDSFGAYSTIPRKPKTAPKKVERSQTMSPQKKVPDIPGLSPVSRAEASSSTTPPVVIAGKLVHDYQYNRPIPPKSPLASDDKTKVRTKVTRNQSMSKLLRLVTIPQKSPLTTHKNGDTPLRELYKKTVMSHSVPYSLNVVGTSPTKSENMCNISEVHRHNSASNAEETQYFSNSNDYYSTLPLPRKQKR